MALPAKAGVKAGRGEKRPARSVANSTYRVDLPAYHADCDANYLRLCKLLPQLSSRRRWHYQLPHGALDLSVVQCSRYTTELNLEASGGEWLSLPQITVRLYHDARMAEVVAVDGRGPVGGDTMNFAYPNRRMQGADERQQANRFLGEWLAHCMACGRAQVELVLDGKRLC